MTDDPRRTVGDALRERAERLRADLHGRWGDVPHRRREIPVPGYQFPEAPDAIFPWVSLCLVVDERDLADPDRVVLVDHGDHDYPWEPPGGKGEAPETPAETARREVREETGLDCAVTDLLFTESLVFDYGDATAPVLQAVFAGRRTGGRLRPDGGDADDEVVAARWFAADDLDPGVQFADEIRAYLRE